MLRTPPTVPPPHPEPAPRPDPQVAPAPRVAPPLPAEPGRAPGPAEITVFILDESAALRQALSELLATTPGVRVIGTARDTAFAQRRLERCWPDVVILDVDSPGLGGQSFLEDLMARRPTPVIACASGADTLAASMARRTGAVDVIVRPQERVRHHLEEARVPLAALVHRAARTQVAPCLPPARPRPKLNADVVLPYHVTTRAPAFADRIVAIGTSTGGTQALETVLSQLPRHAPPLVIVQHMPGTFTAAFARRLDQISETHVKEAEPGDTLAPGLALVAPGDRHLLVRRQGPRYAVELHDGPPVSRHRPSVDVLFRSVALAAGPHAVGIIMTGMGDDGCRGLLEMHQAGALTIAQTEATCVVYGMPKEAVARGAVDGQEPLEALAAVITAAPTRDQYLRTHRRPRPT